MALVISSESFLRLLSVTTIASFRAEAISRAKDESAFNVVVVG